MTGTVDKITFTMSGYQQTTIDGVVYATTFDFADLPGLTKGSRVEYERTGQRAQFYDFQRWGLSSTGFWCGMDGSPTGAFARPFTKLAWRTCCGVVVK